MTIKDLITEEIFFGGDVFVASAGNAAPYWSGTLYAGIESDLRSDSGTLPHWFDRMEVAAIGAAADGGLLIAVR